MPKISVIMLTYNRRGLVGRAIESVLAQTFADFEYIIVDNGSTDTSGVIADEYALKDGRVTVIHRARGNIGSGRNAGLDAARGEYVTFVDDDDYVEPDFLEFLYNMAEENDADVTICGRNDKQFAVKKVMDSECAITELLSRQYYSTGFPGKLIKSKIFTMRFSSSAKYDDIELMAHILALAARTAYDGTPKYNVTRDLPTHNSNWTRNYSHMKSEDLREYLSVYTSRSDWLCEKFPGKEKLWRYFEWSFMLSMVEKIITNNLTGCRAEQEKMLNILRENKIKFQSSDFIQPFEKEWLEKYV